MIALPLCGLLVLGASRELALGESEALERALARARMIAACADDHVMRIDLLLASLGVVLGQQPRDLAAVRDTLGRLPVPLSIGSGSLRMDSFDGVPPTEVDPAVRRALERGGFATGAPARGANGAGWTLGVARRIDAQGGAPPRVASVSMPLAGLREMLDLSGLPEGSRATLINEDGLVLAQAGAALNRIGFRPADPGAHAAGAPAAQVRTDQDGIDWFAGSAMLANTPWRVQVEIPADEVLRQRRREIWLSLAAMLALAAAAVVLARRTADGVAARLARLAADAERFAAGDFTHRSVAGGAVGERVAVALNLIADTVRERESLLREGEARFRAMVEASPVGIFLARLDGNTVYTNPAYLRILGLGEDAARDLGWISAIHPEDRDSVASAWHKSISSGVPYAGHGRYLHRDGRVVWWQIRTAEVQVGAKMLGLVGMVEDVTEVREAQAALADSERRYRAMFASNPQPMWVYDVETLRFLDVNDAAIAHYGYTREEFRAMTVQDIRPEEDRSFQERPGGGAGGATVMQGVRRHLRKNGRRIDVEVASHDLMFKGRRAVHVLVNDVTDRSRVEREILSLNVELEERVAARTAELTAANNELEAFTYSVAHDLRAPLRGIDGFSALLVEHSSSRLEPDAAVYVDRIRAASQRMGAMISDLLDLSRVSRSELFRMPVDLSALAREIRDEMQRVNPDHRVSWEIAPDLRTRGDPGLIRLVLDNLIGNAWKYSSDAERPHIEFGRRPGPDGRAEFFVRDNGVGFDMQYAGKLFSVFQRLHSADKYEGTGIGLATVKRIIERHGGGVRGDGTLGKGATFSFWLPPD